MRCIQNTLLDTRCLTHAVRHAHTARYALLVTRCSIRAACHTLLVTHAACHTLLDALLHTLLVTRRSSHAA